MSAMLGDLPTWNLADLYSSPTGPDLETDLKRAAAEAEAFARDYEGKVAGLDGNALGGAIARNEKMSDLMGRIGSYASLYYASDMADPERGRFSQNVSENLTDIGSRLLFFGLEVKRLEDADLADENDDCWDIVEQLMGRSAPVLVLVTTRADRPCASLRAGGDGCCSRRGG